MPASDNDPSMGQSTPRSAAYRIFWLGRYIERAEGNARLLDVRYYGGIEAGPGGTPSAPWESALRSLGLWEAFVRTGLPVTDRHVAEYLLRGETNSSSLLRCIEQARENANGAAPDEIFVELNRLYLLVKSTATEEIWRQGLHEFISGVIRSIHTIGGMIDRLWA
ncbi:MAG: alpha-E domain-containing protein [Candidatus Hydrogenedentota bacterium]